MYSKNKSGIIEKRKQTDHFTSTIDDRHIVSPVLILDLRSWSHFYMISQEKLGFVAINYKFCN